MDIPRDPDKRARTYERFRRAHADIKELKPVVDAMAAEDLAAGATIKELSDRTGLLPEVFRRKARKADVPVDPRYKERAERLRAPRVAPTPEAAPSNDDSVDINALPRPTVASLAAQIEEAEPADWVLAVTSGAPKERAPYALVIAAVADGRIRKPESPQ